MTKFPLRICGGPDHTIEVGTTTYIVNAKPSAAESSVLYPVSEFARAVAAGLFENAPVFDGHKNGDPRHDRVHQKVGRVTSVFWSSRDLSVFGLFTPAGPGLEARLLEAKTDQLPGVSGYYKVLFEPKPGPGGLKIVREIVKVESVDFVSVAHAGGAFISGRTYEAALRRKLGVNARLQEVL